MRLDHEGDQCLQPHQLPGASNVVPEFQGTEASVMEQAELVLEPPAQPTAEGPPDALRREVPVRPTALRKLNNPAASVGARWPPYLPMTLGELARREGDPLASPHQALRFALVQAIDRLAPGSGEQNLQRRRFAVERTGCLGSSMASYQACRRTGRSWRSDAYSNQAR